jgi:N-acetyl-anhydromuramyl-L-alanine amidase AmpD
MKIYPSKNLSSGTSYTLYEPRHGVPVGHVLHGTGGTNSLAWLQRYEPDPKKKSSADYLIGRDGLIMRLTPYGMFSYHAGRSWWNGKQDMMLTLNATHFGVEHEQLNDNIQAPTEDQYAASAYLWASHALKFSWSRQDTCTHAQCALPRGRKVDPLPWDLAHFWALVNEYEKWLLSGQGVPCAF